MYVIQSQHYGNIELGRPQDALWSQLKRIMQYPPGAPELGKLVQGISHLRQHLHLVLVRHLHLVVVRHLHLVIVRHLHLVLLDSHLQTASQEQLHHLNCYQRELNQLKKSALQPLLPHQALRHLSRLMCVHPER